MWVYLHSEHSAEHDLFTVGFYDPSGRWQADSDHASREEAAKRCAWLNGGREAAEVQ